MRRLSLSLFIFALLASFWFTSPVANATESFDLVIFYGNTCPHCHHALAYFQELQDEYPEMQIHEYEVYANRDNIPKFLEFAENYGVKAGAVPTIFIGEQAMIGFSREDVLAAVQDCAENGCPSALLLGAGETPSAPKPPELIPPRTEDIVLTEVLPSVPAAHAAPVVPETESSSGHLQQVTLPAVVAGAAVDAINPCAFAVLIILVTTVLGSGNRRRALFAGLAFATSIFISYYLMGLGLYSAVAATGISQTFFLLVSILAILIGLFNLKDWLWYGRWFVMEVPMSWRPRLQKLIRGVTSVPGAFAIGFLVSLFLLPCTSGPYVIILGLLAKETSRGTALWYLALYNAIFVAPMIVITLAVALGITTTDKAEAWRQSKLRFLHLIAGLIILGLGVAMLGSVLLGYI